MKPIPATAATNTKVPGAIADTDHPTKQNAPAKSARKKSPGETAVTSSCPDTLEALQELAAYHRSELGVRILAITGQQRQDHDQGVGRPYAVAEIRNDRHPGQPEQPHRGSADTAVDDARNRFRRGRNGSEPPARDRKALRDRPPDFGLITNIGRSHLEGFGGPEGVRKGKGELLDYLAANSGTAFYLSDDAVLSEMVAERRTYTPSRTTLPA